MKSGEAEIRRIKVWSQCRQKAHNTLYQKTLHKKGLVEWLKVKALSSNPSTQKKHKAGGWPGQKASPYSPEKPKISLSLQLKRLHKSFLWVNCQIWYE
jgi:hypothetical protein